MSFTPLSNTLLLKTGIFTGGEWYVSLLAIKVIGPGFLGDISAIVGGFLKVGSRDRSSCDIDGIVAL